MLGSQQTEPAANACSNAESVSAWRPNSNQCLYLARLAKTRKTPWASRAMYALTLFSILAFYPWFNPYSISVLDMFTFDVFQRFRRVKPTATVFRAGPRVHPIQHFATAAFFPVHFKTISASGPTNARSMRPIPFPTGGILPRFPVSGT